MKFSAKILLSLIAFTFLANSAISQNNIIDEIVWVVGDEAILKSEVEEYRKEIQMQNQRIDGDPYCFIPEQLAKPAAPAAATTGKASQSKRGRSSGSSRLICWLKRHSSRRRQWPAGIGPDARPNAIPEHH